MIKNRVLKMGFVDWKALEFIQPAELKELTEADFKKLKSSIKKNGFAMGFAVWQPEHKKLYGLDGYHRVKALLELEAEGEVIPEKMPATWIECKNKKEAAQVVLLYSAHYARVRDEGLYQFYTEFNLDKDFITELSMAELDVDTFINCYLNPDYMPPEPQAGAGAEDKLCPQCGYNLSKGREGDG